MFSPCLHLVVSIARIHRLKAKLEVQVLTQHYSREAVRMSDSTAPSTSEDPQTLTGTVKWFNDAKGFGFITPDNGGEDLFAHFSSIQMNDFNTLKKGQKVEFEIVKGQKGKKKLNIK